MKRIITALLAVFIAAMSFSACTVVHIAEEPQAIENVTIVSNSRKYRAEEIVAKNSVDKLTASLAKNEAEGMQFLLKFDEGATNVSVSMTAPTDEKGNTIKSVELFREHYYFITKQCPAYPTNGQYPDALIPLAYDDLNMFDIKAWNNQGIWITVTTPADQPAGIYTAEVTVTHDGGIIKIPVEIEVWDFTLPDSTPFETYYGMSGGSVYQVLQHNNALDGRSTTELAREYFWFFTKYRINPGHMFESSGNPVDEANLVKSYLDDSRIQNMKLYIGFIQQSDGSYVLSEYWRQVLTKLREYGLLDKIVTDVIRDEPPDSETISLEARGKKAALAAEFPEVRTTATTAPRPSLYGGIDSWVGIWSSKTTEQEIYVQDRLDVGETVQWYGCIGPQYPYPSYHIQDKLISSRLVHWMQKDWQISGNLYWNATLGMAKYNAATDSYGTRDQWTDAYAFPATAGDGYLVYIGAKNDGVINRNIPVPSMRLESIRDGSEDNIYLTLLEDKIQQKLDKWGITDITADTVMDTYYAPLYNTMGDFDHDETLMLEMRKILAQEIMSDSESIITVLPFMNSESINNREVRVYAESGAVVSIDGKAAMETESGNHSVYSAVFPTALEDFQKITVTVNGESFTRYLKRIEDYEYMELEENNIKATVKALGLPIDYIEVREEAITNMFTKETTQSLGSLEDQLNNALVADRVKRVISTDSEMAAKIRNCIATDISNTIPLVVSNEDIIDNADDVYKKLLKIYVPHGAQITVDENSATLAEETDNYDMYIYKMEILQPERHFYTIKVTCNGKTETFTKIVMQTTAKGLWLVDFNDPVVADSLAGIKTNKYGTGTVVEDNCLKLTYNKSFIRATIKSDAFQNASGDLSGYTTLRFTVTNTSDHTVFGVSFRMTLGSSEIEIGSSGYLEAGQTKTVLCKLPNDILDNSRLQGVTSIKVFSTEIPTLTDTYEIKNLMMLNIEDVK